MMPIWRPPTPPTDDSDLYVDPSLDLLYDMASTMPESELPATHTKRESSRRLKMESSVFDAEFDSPTNIRGTVLRTQREESSRVPRSLFERRDITKNLKLLKYRHLGRSFGSIKHQLLGKVETEPLAEWQIHEDWLILHVLRKILQLSLNLSLTSIGHTPNWDLLCDFVNSYSPCYRSPRHCRFRYENVVVPREENKDTESSEIGLMKKGPKKQKLNSGLQKSGSRSMGTSQLLQQDNNSKYSSLCSVRFETIKSITNKKTPTMKPMHINPVPKNSKHAQILSENGIIYDDPLLPSQVAAKRVERIKEQLKTQVEAQQQQKTPGQASFSQLQRQFQPTLASSQHIAVLTTGASGQQTLATKVGSSVVLNQGVATNLVPAVTLSSVSAISSGASGIQTTVTGTTTVTSAFLGGVRTAQVGSSAQGRTTLTIQDLQRSGSGSQTTIAGLSQIQAAKLTALTSQSSSAQTAIQTRTLIPQQMQYLRQHSGNRQTLTLHSGKIVATSSSSNTTTSADQTIKRITSATSPKVQVAVSSAAISGISAIQMVKPGTMVASAASNPGTSAPSKTVSARTVTESEMNAILRRQPQQITKVGQIAQMFAKNRSIVGVKGATVGTLQLGKSGLGGTGLSTVQIVQGGAQKQMTVQQIQQVFKQVQQQQQQQNQQTGAITGTVVNVAKTMPSNTGSTSKLLHVSTSQPIKQTIQVVSGGTSPGIQVVSGGSSPGIQVVSAVSTPGIQVISTGTGASSPLSNVRIQSQGERSGGGARMTSPAIISLGTGQVHAQPFSLSARPPTSTVKLQTTAVTISNQSGSSQDQSTETND